MYNEFYGFKEKPFSLTPDPHFLYLSSVHKKALAYLTYGLEDRKGFITVTGEVGAGKTTLIRALLSRMNTSNTMVSRIINTTVTSLQLLKMIVRDFGIKISSSAKEDILEELNEFLLEQYALGRNAVIIVDEAQNLEKKTLEEIRLLSNLETEKDKLLQIILVGQPELRQTLADPGLRQLRQRITVNYHISPLNNEEVVEYIRHRLRVARAKNPEMFTEEAMSQIAVAAKGIPRIINIICDAALVTGYVEGSPVIDEKFVEEVLNDLDLDYYTASDTQYNVPGLNFSKKSEDMLRQEIEQLSLHHQDSHLLERDIEDKARQLQEQMNQLGNVMNKLLLMEQELEKRAERIKKKEEELGI